MTVLSEKDKLPPDDAVKVWVGYNTGDAFKELDRWNSYNISLSVMDPVHTFELNFAGTESQRDKIFRFTGQRIFVFSHGALQLSGVVQERSDATNRAETDNILTGRSTAGLPMDSAIPFNQLSLAGLTLERIALKWLDPWIQTGDIPGVITNNAANRYIMAGGYVGGRRAGIKVGITPLAALAGGFHPSQLLFKMVKAKKARKRLGKFGKDSPYFSGTTLETLRTSKVQPGTKVIDGLNMLAEQIGAHIHQSVDGSIVISRPTYKFDPSAYGVTLELLWDKEADKASGGNIQEVKLDTSVAERASEYTIVSSVKSKKSSKGSNLFHTKGIKDPSPAFWADDALTTNRLHKPTVINVKKMASSKMVSRLARRTMTRKALGGISYTMLLPGHHAPSGSLWVPDSMVQVNDQRNGINKAMYIAKVERRFDRDTGRTTLLDLKPPDVWLGQFDQDTTPLSTFNKEMRKRIFW